MVSHSYVSLLEGMVLFWGVVKHLKEVVLTARQEPNGEDVEANYEELSKEEKEEAW